MIGILIFALHVMVASAQDPDIGAGYAAALNDLRVRVIRDGFVVHTGEAIRSRPCSNAAPRHPNAVIQRLARGGFDTVEACTPPAGLLLVGLSKPHVQQDGTVEVTVLYGGRRQAQQRSLNGGVKYRLSFDGTIWKVQVLDEWIS